jgi:two-component system cell cycle sensor histidine kinase PleC
MLSYFKYFAVITFFVVAAAAFFAGVYFRSFAADKVIRASIEQENVQTADNYTKEVWCKYEPFFKELIDKPAAEWQKNENFLKLGRINKTIFTASSAFKVSFYSTSKEEIFTTNDADLVFFDEAGERKGLLKAFAGGVSSILVQSMGYHDKAGALVKGSFVQSFILLDTTKCPGTVAGQTPLKVAMEVYTDVTKPWAELYIFQLVVTLGIITTFILLYLALFITSKKTEKIINKQHEEKLNLEKAKATAEAQNQQKSMFLANVSHELRTPLNAIIGFSDIIKDEVMGPVGHPQYKEYVNDINSSGIHLLSLINDILDYSKAEASKLEVEFIDIDVSKIGLSCLRLVEPRANAAKVTLVSHIPEKHITLSADPKRMKQVILNLLSNSVKFTPEGGQVSLTIEDDLLDNKVTIKVIDNGIGIAAKDISKALAPFGQIDSSLSRKYEGTGLGLPLTKKLCEIMGGTFDIKSEVGLGTTIALVFSATAAEKTEESAIKF